MNYLLFIDFLVLFVQLVIVEFLRTEWQVIIQRRLYRCRPILQVVLQASFRAMSVDLLRWLGLLDDFFRLLCLLRLLISWLLLAAVNLLGPSRTLQILDREGLLH